MSFYLPSFKSKYNNFDNMAARKTVDFTQLQGIEDIYGNVLRYLTDADVTRLSQVNRFSQNATYDERLKRKCFTYGAAAVPEKHESILKNILGAPNNWKVSKDAMTFVARTFSGAKIDGTFKFEQLHPDLFGSSHAFHMVREWWEWMCDNNRDVALKTDMLSFLLFAGEAIKAKRHRTVYENVDYKDNVQKIKFYNLRNFTFTQNDETFYGAANRNVALWKSKDDYFFFDLDNSYLGLTLKTCVSTSFGGKHEREYSIQRRAQEFGPVDNPEEVPDLKLHGVSTRLWAHACLDKIASTTELASLYHPDVLQQDTLKTLHVAKTETFTRGGYFKYANWELDDDAFIMF